MKKGILYLVSTPIGNLKDITLRALNILKEVGLIAAEDTRHTRKLLTYYKITTPLTSYFEYNEAIKAPSIIKRLESGEDIALVSDAGTPGISDPGYRLVRLAIEHSIPVVPIPGPSSILSVLSASGIPTTPFAFLGFIPLKKKDRRLLLARLKREDKTVVLYESPRRLLTTLRDIHSLLGNIDMVVAREITKIHEEFIRGKVSQIIEKLKDRTIKGEITLILNCHEMKEKPRPLLESLVDYQRLGISIKEAVKLVAEEQGLPRGVVYREALKLKDKIR